MLDTWQGVHAGKPVTVWDAMSGRIRVLWMEAAVGAGLKDGDHE